MADAAKWVPLNFQLMANPVNWVIVTLMVAIAGLAIALIFPQAAKEGSNAK